MWKRKKSPWSITKNFLFLIDEKRSEGWDKKMGKDWLKLIDNDLQDSIKNGVNSNIIKEIYIIWRVEMKGKKKYVRKEEK